ncbi:putative actinidain [Helianthus annuus]|nr:putative actinidain [Helianthus annuus]KAJ0756677.1 putative actinidain [Helianthus annuus]KAJ0760426.1 putative actinidain [Helianthus annuus]
MREKKRHPASMGILFLFVVFTVSAVAMPDATATTTSFSLLSESELYTMFKSWLVKHGKSYSLPVEEDVRFKIFKDNVRYIEEHNAGDHSYKLGVNKLADLSIEEYRSTYTGIKKVDSKQKGKLENVVSDRYSVNPGEILPLSVDWRSKGAVTSVKDQGRCGE